MRKSSRVSASKGSFTGTSQSGDLAEALADAIRQAEESSGIVDLMVRWKLDRIFGEHGGFAGKKEISVTISVDKN